MKRSILTAMTLMTFVLVFALNTTAASVEEAAKEAARIERVRWSGLSLGGWRIFGSWAIAPAEPSLFGAASPYFRLNGDDETVFRGLGRESNFVQRILPTLHSRKKLRDIMNADETASQSLLKFDSQVATGEKIHMGSTALVAGGKTGIVAGVVMIFLGLGEAAGAVEEETPAMMKAGYNVAILGTSLWFAGRIGQLAGNIVTKQAFSHLNDAMDYYNKRKG